jgi:uncharacterized protein (TIGR00369 family)
MTDAPASPADPSHRISFSRFTGDTGPLNIHKLLDVEVIEASAEKVVLSLPVNEKVHQPYGILHGGVSALLAESAASFGAALAAPPGRSVVGIELNASHLRGMRSGTLIATATPVRTGRTVSVWSIHLTDEDGKPVCMARCTLAVVDERPMPPRPTSSSDDGAEATS